MKQYRGSIKTDKTGSDCAFEFEAEARDAAFNRVEWYFEEVKA